MTPQHKQNYVFVDIKVIRDVFFNIKYALLDSVTVYRAYNYIN